MAVRQKKTPPGCRNAQKVTGTTLLREKAWNLASGTVQVAANKMPHFNLPHAWFLSPADFPGLTAAGVEHAAWREIHGTRDFPCGDDLFRLEPLFLFGDHGD